MIDIIPAIDLINGQCIRLSQGDFTRQTTYRSDPVAVAEEFESMGLKRLHLVDLDGARSGQVTNLHVLREIARHTSLQIDFSGGIQTDEDMDQVLAAGAAMVGIGSLAASDPATVIEWAARYGPERILLGADVRDERIVTKGWLHQTDISVDQFIENYSRHQIRNIFCTDVRKDGMMQGPALTLYQRIRERFPEIHLIASGGVRVISDIMALDTAGCNGVIVGKAFYEGQIGPSEIQQFITTYGTC